MGKTAKKRSRKAGLPPGSLVYVGERGAEEVKITVFDYGESCFEESVKKDFKDRGLPREESAVRWIKVDGVHDVEVLDRLGKCFELHPLTLEDILNTDQRPKMEDFDRYVFIVMKMIRYDDMEGKVTAEQVSLVVSSDVVISLHEGEADMFRPVVERLRSGKGRLRRMGADYLAYTLLDAVVDDYFLVLEKLGDAIELLEEEIATDPKPETMHSIHGLRREMVLLHRWVWPLGEVANSLILGDTPLIGAPSRVYFKDVHDHIVQATDTIETYREILTEMLTIYLSAVSNKLNEVMKVLTIIATIFMPLTFIAGIYGMNFVNMPELHSPWGYPLALLFMFVLAASMLIYFKRKGWL